LRRARLEQRISSRSLGSHLQLATLIRTSRRDFLGAEPAISGATPISRNSFVLTHIDNRSRNPRKSSRFED
jgi:hypothetical protein